MVTGHARSASAVGPGQALPIHKVFHKYNNLSTLTEGGKFTAPSHEKGINRYRGIIIKNLTISADMKACRS